MDRNKTIISIIVIIVAVAMFIGVALWLFNPKNAQTAGTSQALPVQYVQGMGGSVDSGAKAAGAAGQMPDPSAGASPQAPAVNVTSQQILVVDGAGNPITSDYQVGPDGLLVRNPTDAGRGAAAAPQAGAAPSASPLPMADAGGASAKVRTDSGLVVSAGTQQGKAEISVKAVPKSAEKSPVPKAAAKAEKSAAMPQAKPAAKTKDPAAKASPAVKGGKEYWIQVISTTSKDRVEQVRKDLAALGFNGRVMAFAKDGNDFYRLRYGPYADREEAAKFLEWVKIIKGLDGSFIAEEKAGVPAAATAPAKPAAKPDSAASPSPKPGASPTASPAPAASPKS
jgi:cell division septation protein DedD